MIDTIKSTVCKLEQERKHLQEKLKVIDNIIHGLQSLCTHNWVGDGHDSHYSYQKCTICGLRFRE